MTVLAALLLAAGNAAALGLGQIEVKSRLNQPLLAEIPIISTTPGELEALQARLASPDTFRRVGLAPPSGAAANLQFSLGSDARGRPVIRVTTVAPVDQAVLNFLIEVDWGQGRLVREYSALVDAPRTTSAPVQPPISAPVVAAPNVVQRPVELAPQPAPVAVPPPAPTRPSPLPPVAQSPMPAPAEAEPVPSPIAIAPLPPTMPSAARPAPVPAAATPPAAAEAPAHYGPIKQGETLSKIASKLDLPGGYSLDQGMLALLRANPDAFLGDDINRLKRGAVLRVPGDTELGRIGADEATLVVREQMQQWRQARRAVAQPTATAATDGKAPAVAAATTAVAKPAAKSAATAPRRQQAQARLEIVPPSAPGKATGTRSGTNAGGEGSMLQQQLRQKDEDIAAKTSEIGDLKERVAELEKLQQQQQQLLTLKDSELAAAQQRLAEAHKTAAAAPAMPAATTAQAAQTARAPETPQASNTLPWLWGGFAFIGVALLAWLFVRRSRSETSSKPVVRRGFDSEALAASMVAPTLDAVPQDAIVAVADEPPAPAVTVVELDAVPTSPSPRSEAPNWHSGWVKAEKALPPATAAPQPRFVPLTEAEPRTPPPQASAEQRMKLARAFLDIGDDHSAKELLREVLDGPDPAMRTEAARLLRELG
ncbi:FimV/HubP family polar landmark protein [Thermomonas sp. HDW16]|uniref:type IV pilus assembly protein FimV n=1 Tax=Thermomonas sp. HDW16 TaxID=2714945 RepID=UPI00140AB118|nr:FimV/HubP family polar landmark protein [Thermomonas sp. HDW16]QIL21727.1 hypothetical protein G7079_06640 [Thermomonas sp. HDW16]